MTLDDIHHELAREGLTRETEPYAVCSTEYRMKFENALRRAGFDEEGCSCEGCQAANLAFDELWANDRQQKLKIAALEAELARAINAQPQQGGALS